MYEANSNTTYRTAINIFMIYKTEYVSVLPYVCIIKSLAPHEVYIMHTKEHLGF